MIFYNNKFKGFYPIGASAVVVADSPEEAAGKLNIELAKLGIEQLIPYKDMISIDENEKCAIILNDGIIK